MATSFLVAHHFTLDRESANQFLPVDTETTIFCLHIFHMMNSSRALSALPLLLVPILASGQVYTGADSPPESANLIGSWEDETGFYQALEVTKDSPIYDKDSEYQHIEVHKSKYYGKILVLDGVVQLTEKDADSYNEMMAHLPMMQHINPKRVLVIGGGDGYVVSEVLKYESTEAVDHVDLDKEVVETCRQHFSWGAAWDDERVTFHAADGAAFVKNAPDATYDVIVQDSSDPWTFTDKGEKIPLPSEVLYTKEHFANLVRILKPNGVLNLQAETYNIPSDLEGISQWVRQAKEVGFQRARYGSLYTSSYPTGQIGFLLCEKGDESEATTMEEVKRRFASMARRGLETTYFHPPLQQSSFDLPLWVERSIYADDAKTTADEL